jgi:hypothetical protein
MAWTETTLKEAIQSYVEVEDEDNLVANLDTIIKQAEDRILKNVQIPDFRKSVTGTVTVGDQYLSIPSDFLSPYSISIDNGGYEFLLFKEVNYIRQVYPSPSDRGTPRFYSIWDDNFFLLGPTPDIVYNMELHYFYRPPSIVDSVDGTSWIGTNAESTLLAACLLESYIFLKGDADLLATYAERYKESLQELKFLGEWRNKADQFRSSNV